jgi:hypothetical protein
MKASELIEALKKSIDAYGDLEVETHCEDPFMDYSPEGVCISTNKKTILLTYWKGERK